MAAAGLLAATAPAAGCGSPAVTVYEPGVYKGKADPLVDKMARETLQPDLRTRLVQGQTDR